jgi:hypothetical protein
VKNLGNRSLPSKSALRKLEAAKGCRSAINCQRNEGPRTKDLAQTCREGSSPSQTQSRQLRASLGREKYNFAPGLLICSLLLSANEVTSGILVGPGYPDAPNSGNCSARTTTLLGFLRTTGSGRRVHTPRMASVDIGVAAINSIPYLYGIARRGNTFAVERLGHRIHTSNMTFVGIKVGSC